MKKLAGITASKATSKDGTISIVDIAILFDDGELEITTIPINASPTFTSEMLRSFADRIEKHGEEPAPV